MLPIRLETERLVLRPFTEADILPSYEMNLDPEITRYTADGGVVDLEETRRRITEHVWGDYQRHGYGRLAVEMKATGEFIGFAGLKYLEDMEEVDIGYRFVRAHWGQGIATEAGEAVLRHGFQSLGLSRVIGLVVPENVGSIRVLEKLGFTFEKDLEVDGVGAKVYGLEKSDFS